MINEKKIASCIITVFAFPFDFREGICQPCASY